MAGMTKSPQLRLSPLTAKVHDEAGDCAPADAAPSALNVRSERKTRSLNMLPE
jgi:hypothetical protein